MQRRTHFLESFSARDAEGRVHKVRAYEHEVQVDALLADGQDHWEPTGQLEYRLDSGEAVELMADGTIEIRAREHA